MTATTSVFGEANLFDLARENSDAEDRVEELAKQFAHLPRSCIQDVYEHLCQRNFDWTVDYLRGLQQEKIDLYANDEDSAGLTPGSPSYSHSQAQSSPIDSRQPKRRSRGKRNQKRLTEEQLALKQNLENLFILNQESYPKYTLKFKKWKNKADNKKVTEEAVFPAEITKFSKMESQEERQLRITRMMLDEKFPHCDDDAFYNILDATNRDLKETIKIVMENSREQPSLPMADVLKKEKNLCKSLENDGTNKTLRHHHTVNRSSDQSSGDKESDSQVQMTIKELMEYATNCRHKASAHLKLRLDNLTKARMATRAKMGDLARTYVNRAEIHRNQSTLLNERAASALLEAQVHRHQDDTIIDLHYLHVVEALTSLDIFIEGHLAGMTQGQHKILSVITGRGKHSPDQKSKIKPAVSKRLNVMNIRFQERKTNAGMLNVYLRKK